MNQTEKTSKAWDDLKRELDLWRQDSIPATLWWRDDDAQHSSAQLDRLIQLSITTQIPLVLATIPHQVEPFLSDKTGYEKTISIVQHGWSHTNHAPQSEKKCELGDHRSPDIIRQELTAGADILKDLFGEAFLPVMVPPWNRISDSIASHLQEFGYRALSTYGNNSANLSNAGFCQANTHVDLIDWKGHRGFIGTQNALHLITTHLEQRRCGQIPQVETTGILTHHLVHDESLWQFLQALFQFTSNHNAAQWQTGQEVFKG